MAELLVTDLPQARERRLEGVLRSWRAQYDLVLRDCPAHKGLLLVNALNAADGVLIPVPSQDQAYAALARTAATIAAVWEYHNLAILGYLLTMTNHSTAAAGIVAAVRADFPALIFRAAIPRRVAVTVDARYQAPLGVYAPTSAAAVAYRDLAGEVLARVQAQRTPRLT